MNKKRDQSPDLEVGRLAHRKSKQLFHAEQGQSDSNEDDDDIECAENKAKEEIIVEGPQTFLLPALANAGKGDRQMKGEEEQDEIEIIQSPN